MRQTLCLLLMGAIALASHLGESDAIAIGSEVKENQTVSTANETITVPNSVGLNDTIQLTITNNGTGAKTQREIVIGDEITQLFFGEANAGIGKGSNSGPGVMVTPLETISEQVPVVPVQPDANAGTAFDSLAVPIDSRPSTLDSSAIGAEELGIQQTVKKVDELITQVQQTQVQQETNNFGVPVIVAGDSFTASETDKLQLPTEMVDSKIFQVEQETMNGGVAPSVTAADIVTSNTGTAGEGFQINLAGVQEMSVTPIVGVVDQMTTQIPIFWPSGDEPGQFKIEHTINPNTEESVNKMQTSVNFSGAAKQIPIFIHSKIKHAVFNIHVHASPPTSPAVHRIVKKPEDYSLDIEIGVPAIQPQTETEMPSFPQVAQVKEINLELPDLIVISSGSTESPVYQVPTVAQMNSFEIDKMILGELNQTPTTPADTFTIDTAQTGDQLLLVQTAEIPNIISDDRTMRSALASLSIVPNPAQQLNDGRLPSPVINSGHIDDAVDDNISLEIIGFIPRNQLPINNQTVVETRRPILVKFDDVSAEVLGRFNGSQAIFLSRPSSVKVSSHGENRQNGSMVVPSVRMDPVQPTNTLINGDDNSGEIDVDVSVEKADIRTSNLSRQSDEQDDMSLEVDFDLLPQIERLLRRQFQKKPKNPKMVFFHHHSDEQDDDAFELNNILANRVFQRKLQEMDERFKSAPEARGKRLMEKYAEALAMSFSSSAATTINFSLYFPLLIACLLVKWFS
ncbi:hypothetical protein DAPPUDRAFT_314059 [Daphnia pulex]|uniref:Uncharacterized protein n=1 Tax=Daphnia pulex TaxID=6669 RepID=E9G4K4_DAPPU|nr:hypothetical protein DAPPUDRAFT_314059 [Daphnia pulex]|eukprot:EFX85543.1 hypothetical protein DAPPUDRAFT_314059 [Daphnia pulex]